jgi:hypothetical protein
MKEEASNILCKCVVKFFGRKFGNAQTWCTSIDDGNLEKTHMEDGAKIGTKQSPP